MHSFYHFSVYLASFDQKLKRKFNSILTNLVSGFVVVVSLVFIVVSGFEDKSFPVVIIHYQYRNQIDKIGPNSNTRLILINEWIPVISFVIDVVICPVVVKSKLN